MTTPLGRLIETPWPRTPAAKLSSERRSEFQYPSPHRFVGEIQYALREQILDVAITERETHIKPTACQMMGGGKWWRANEIVMRRLNRLPDAGYRSRDKAHPTPLLRRRPERTNDTAELPRNKLLY